LPNKTVIHYTSNYPCSIQQSARNDDFLVNDSSIVNILSTNKIPHTPAFIQ